MIAITITTIVLILAMVALVIGGLMWERQGCRDTTTQWDDVPPDLRDHVRFSSHNSIDQELEQTRRRIELYQLAMHQLRTDQLHRERELIRLAHCSPQGASHPSHFAPRQRSHP